MREGANINRSLLSLTNCIVKLGTDGGETFTNFRDSKLTRILKDSLSGNSRTLMISCISKASTEYENTLKTLNYCEKATRIKKPYFVRSKTVKGTEVKRIIDDKSKNIIKIDTDFLNGSKREQSSVKKNPTRRTLKKAKAASNERFTFSEEYKELSSEPAPSDIGHLVGMLRSVLKKKKKIDSSKDLKQYTTASNGFYKVTDRIVTLMESIRNTGSLVPSRSTCRKGQHLITEDQDETLSKIDSKQLMAPTSEDADTVKQARSVERLVGFSKLFNIKITDSASRRLIISGSKDGKSREKKLNLEREMFRTFKRDLETVHKLKKALLASRSKTKKYQVLGLIENLIRNKKQKSYILAERQQNIYVELVNYLKSHKEESMKKTAYYTDILRHGNHNRRYFTG